MMDALGRVFCGGTSIAQLGHYPQGASSWDNLIYSERCLAEAQRQQLMPHICIHPNCPICKKEANKQAKLATQQAKLAKKKKQDYDKRVKNWLKIIRRKI